MEGFVKRFLRSSIFHHRLYLAQFPGVAAPLWGPLLGGSYLGYAFGPQDDRADSS
jgi:hypothetical protein